MSVVDDESRVFAEPWQAQAFVIVLKLHEQGLFTWQEWADTLAAEIRENQGEYYEQWLSALEKLAERKQLISRDEREARIDEWDRAARATPHGQPIELTRIRQAPGTSPESNRTSPGSRR